MPEATFWFASPFREWIGQRTVTVRWEGCLTLGEALQCLAAQHPRFQQHVLDSGLNQHTFNDRAAVLMDGNFLSLESLIPDRATVDVFTPLSGGVVEQNVVVQQHPNPLRRTASSR